MIASRLLPGCCLALAIVAAPPASRAQGLAAQAEAPRALPRAVPAPVAKTWIKLQQRVDLEFKPGTAVADALKHIQEATIDAEFPNGLTLYMEPGPNRMDGQSQDPPTVSLALKGVPLTAALGFLATQLGRTYSVQQDGIVVLGLGTSERLTEPQARTWLRLAAAVDLPFAEETPLKEVLASLREKTREPGEGEDGPGAPLPIYLDPVGLEKAGQDLDSTVAFRLEGAPLSTSLGLMLDQLGLTYRVQQDGILIITSPDRAPAYDPAARGPGSGMGRMGGSVGGGMRGTGGGMGGMM